MSQNRDLSERQLQRLASEDALARRVLIERKRLGLSQQELAAKVEAILGGGFPQSAVSKIEKPRGRRAITVDEALALSSVLGIPLLELALPPQAAASRTLARLLVQATDATNAVVEATKARTEVYERIAAEMDASPALVDEFNRRLESDTYGPAFAQFLADIYGDDTVDAEVTDVASDRDQHEVSPNETGQVDG